MSPSLPLYYYIIITLETSLKRRCSVVASYRTYPRMYVCIHKTATPLERISLLPSDGRSSSSTLHTVLQKRPHKVMTSSWVLKEHVVIRVTTLFFCKKQSRFRYKHIKPREIRVLRILPCSCTHTHTVCTTYKQFQTPLYLIQPSSYCFVQLNYYTPMI